MTRKFLSFMFLFFIFFSLSACAGKPQDIDNKNIPIEHSEIQIRGVDIYYDRTVGMQTALQQHTTDFTEIVYAAASTAHDTWYEQPCKVYLMGDTTEETDFNFFSFNMQNPENYSIYYADTLKNTLPTLNPEHFSLFVTDFATQLYDYSGVANSMIQNALSKGLAIGFIGIQLDVDENTANSIFLIAISDNQNLSKYIDNFKQNPTIISYSGEQTDFQMDVVKKINYQIIANQSGILGIDYDNIEFIENGFYAGLDGNIDQQEKEGSFTKLNTDYSTEQMETVIEGTVNFTPQVPQFVNPKEIKIEKKQGNDKADSYETESLAPKPEKSKKIKRLKPIYKGVRSLVYNPKENISGKVKVQIPFKVINGVKLSKIQCDLEVNTYVSSGSKFHSVEKSDIKITLADAATPEQGKWRVDDKTNSVIMNILVPNAGNLPIKKGAVKLDIKFKQNDTIDSVSYWIRNWEERGCKNVLNFFSSIYTYQKDGNIAENDVTIYLAPGDKRITQRLSRMEGNGERK